MAVRFNDPSDSISWTSNIPARPWTIMGWFKISTDRNAISCFFAWGDDGTIDYVVAGTLSNGTTLNTYIGSDVSGSALTVGTWYHIAGVMTSTTDYKIYLNGVLDITHTGNSSASSNGRIWIGNNHDNSWLNGCAAAIKVYSVALTPREILSEMQTYQPRRLANLHVWRPLLSTSGQTLSYGGSRNVATVGGVLDTERGPPGVAWGRGSRRYVRPIEVAAGGTVPRFMQNYRRRRVA